MKHLKDLTVSAVEFPHERYVLLKLTDKDTLPEIKPGQFVEVKVNNSPNTYLRRPISVHFVDREKNELWLLIQLVGEGTHQLANLKVGDMLNLLFPLGNGFSPVQKSGERVLLVGGGVGVAPLLEYGKYLSDNGAQPTFLLGARSVSDKTKFPKGTVHVQRYPGAHGGDARYMTSAEHKLYDDIIKYFAPHAKLYPDN